MLLPDFEHGRLTAAAEHILVALAQPFGVGGITLNPSVSIGISVFPENGRDMDTLLRHADMAMYQAKTAGRNRISFFSAEMNRQAQERLALEAALRAMRWKAARCGCTTSRRSGSGTAACTASRRWLAGAIRRWARSRRRASCRWPRNAG